MLLVSWCFSRAPARSLTLTGEELVLPSWPRGALVLDNANQLREVRGRALVAAELSPCVSLELTRESQPAAPPRQTPCALGTGPGPSVPELLAKPEQAPFSALSWTSAAGSCSYTLRADSTKDALRVSWFEKGERCRAGPRLSLFPGASVIANGLVADGKAVTELGGRPGQSTSIQLTATESPLTLGLLSSSPRNGIPIRVWKEPVSLDELWVVAAETFTLRQELQGVENTCEATPWTTIKLRGPGALHLKALALTPEGLQASLGLDGDWEVDTGMCRLSRSKLQWMAFFQLLFAQFIALGCVGWLTERRWF